MKSLRLIALVTLFGQGLALPPTRRADPGFPSPNQQQLEAIEVQASGKLSNAPPPSKLAQSSLTALQLIAFNELFEVAFFTSLLNNITNNVSGYESDNKDALVKAISAVVAQEELHALDAITTLQHFGAFAPSPCQYRFPTTDLKSALALAATFTDVVLGTLQAAEQLFATNGDVGPIRKVASIVGQEGEQNGFYRYYLSLLPSAKPFLTTSTPAYAYSALQMFVVPGSCPFSLADINIPIFTPLMVLSGNGGADVAAKDQDLTFSADLSNCAEGGYVGGDGKGLYVTYLNGQLLPISEPVKNIRFQGNVSTFEANFPFEENIMTGLTIAGLTTANNFSSADDLPNATLAAPGLIQVNQGI